MSTHKIVQRVWTELKTTTVEVEDTDNGFIAYVEGKAINENEPFDDLNTLLTWLKEAL